jgi:hypothetical protein
MSYDHKAQRALNMEAAADPQPGDIWQEMLRWWGHVLDVKDGVVTLWNVGKSREMMGADGTVEHRSIAKFTEFVSYNSIPGTWCEINARKGAAKAAEWRAEYAENVRKACAEALEPPP